MPLSFPKVKDIPLKRPPLREVICQVKFPTILLRIAESLPASFQERIQERFVRLEIDSGIVISELQGKVNFAPPTYRFYSANDQRQVSLAPDFFALSVKDYEHWESFRAELAYVSEAVRDEYGISFASRIGLRYINVIDASFAESGKIREIQALLRPELTAILDTDAIMSPILASHQVRVDDGDSRLTFRYGLFPQEQTSKLQFVLDFDQYIEDTVSLDGLLDRCTRYHDTIYSAFRWCFRDESSLAIFEPMRTQEEV